MLTDRTASDRDNQGTYRSLLYPFINRETENGKAPTSVLLFYCFKGLKYCILTLFNQGTYVHHFSHLYT